MPPLHLVPYQDSYGNDVLRLCEDATGLLVGPPDRRLARLGVYSVNLRGTAHYQRACQELDFSLGTRVRLVRQPGNPHDRNAVAVCARGQAAVAGYVNQRKAAVMTRLLDQGVQLKAVSVRGTGPGIECPAIGIIAAEPWVLAFLLGPRPPGAPAPARRYASL